MVASSTRKKSAKKQNKQKDFSGIEVTKDQAEQIISYTTDYISRWTQRELSKIRINNLPACWPLAGGGYIIGRDRIVPEQGCWRRYNQFNEGSHIFAEKQAAIFYSLLNQVGYGTTADSLLKYDGEVRRLENNLVHYEYSLENAIKNKDCFKIGVYGARFDDARIFLNVAREQLQKIIKSAKYLKVWDQ